LTQTATIHASAVLVGPKAVLIRGPAGSGKSQLAFALIERAASGAFARLVADDRAHIAACSGRLLVRPAPALAGLIEVRGLGIRRLPFEALAAVGLLVDLSAADAARQPSCETFQTVVEGISLRRLAVASGHSPLPLLLAFLGTISGGD
jgi:serine kinase of HPr protein (carbohydrate metabolism regulator)